MKKLASIFMSVLLFAGASYAEDYDPQHTMLALNMAVVSVHRILATQSRAVLDDEYQNIINNLSLGNIRSDPEITKLYEKLLDITSRRKLRNEEAEHLRKIYSEQAKRSLSGALSDFGKNSAAMIREDGSVSAFFGSFSSLVSVGAASYFKFQTGGVTRQGTLDDNLYRLKAEDLADFNDIQKQLLSSSWNLMNRYSLPESYRLVQSSVDDFCRAIENTGTPARKLRMLQAMENDFSVYPPYWYYRAKAAQDCGNDEEAALCYDKFDEVWRPVLRKDPYMLETAKYGISELVRNGVPEDTQTILQLCGVMRENTMRDDWVNNLFAGAVYYALGEKDEGIRCVEINTDFGFEQELSGEVLRLMNKNFPAGLVLSEALRMIKLNEITAGMSNNDKTTAILLADYFDEREGASENLRLARRRPVVLHALRLDAFRRGDFTEILSLTDEISHANNGTARDYAAVMPVLQRYADDDNAIAQTFLADMYLYGLGKGEDSKEAMKLYRKAAEKGERYPQFMYMNLLTESRNVPKNEPEPQKVSVPEQVSPEAKPVQKKEKKPLIRFWPFKR